MRSLAALVGIALLLLFVSAIPAAAITNGVLDDGDPPAHPVVGTFYYVYEEDGQEWIEFGGCSGSLIAPNVVLAAAHCAGNQKYWVEQGYPIFVSFHWDALVPMEPPFRRVPHEGQCADCVAVTEIHLNPAYVGGRWGVGNPFNQDVAVMLLAVPQTHLEDRIRPLPTAGLLDELAAQNGLKNAQFTVVGYGYDVEYGDGRPAWLYANQRSWAVMEYRAITPYYFVVSGKGNEASELGTACSGDSGGPVYLTIDDAPVVVGVTWGIDYACQSLAIPYRLDTDAARDFLGNYVTLP